MRTLISLFHSAGTASARKQLKLAITADHANPCRAEGMNEDGGGGGGQISGTRAAFRGYEENRRDALVQVNAHRAGTRRVSCSFVNRHVSRWNSLEVGRRAVNRKLPSL